jgi:hypothetical protein
MIGHRFGLLLSRDGTKAGRAQVRRAAALAAAAVVGGGMWMTAPAASAGSTKCGPGCINLFNQKFGSADLAAVSGGAAAARQPVILSAAALSATEDWTESFQGKVSDFYAAGLMNATLDEHYGTDVAVEIAYAPGASSTGLCLGIASGPRQNTPVTLQRCGVSVNTVWILDTADANGGYTPLISGSDAQYPAPYVLTANTVGDNFTTQALKANPGAAAGAQRWKAAQFGVPAGNYQWNGYVTNGTAATDVIADWTVPTTVTLRSCGTSGAKVPEWIGLGGVGTPLVQIGTVQVCGTFGGVVTLAVYQIVPAMTQATAIGLLLPGDKVEAEVRYLTGNQYYISITDSSLGWTWSQTVTQPASSVTPQTADWIVEDTGAGMLADFGTFEFTNCLWSNGNGLPSDLTSANAILYEGAAPSGDLQTSVSAISGLNFTIKWLHS